MTLTSGCNPCGLLPLQDSVAPGIGINGITTVVYNTSILPCTATFTCITPDDGYYASIFQNPASAPVLLNASEANGLSISVVFTCIGGIYTSTQPVISNPSALYCALLPARLADLSGK
jgi:hypothetical protein